MCSDASSFNPYIDIWSFPDRSVVKNLSANAVDAGSIPELGRSPGEGNGNPLQNSCLEIPIDREAWQATVHGVTKSQTWQQLNNNNNWYFRFFFPLINLGRGLSTLLILKKQLFVSFPVCIIFLFAMLLIFALYYFFSLLIL